MRNKEISDLLTRMASLLEIKGDLVFKIRAYQRAAENIANLQEEIETVQQENRLLQIPGVGKTLQDKITEYLQTGRLTAYDKLIKEIPETVLDVIDIPSVGPKKAKLFFDELKVKSVEQLKQAAHSGKLLTLPGIKEKTVTNILKGIKVVQQGQKRMTLATATRIAEEFVEALKAQRDVKKIAIAGSLRRGCETVGDIDILIDSGNPLKVIDTFCHLPQVRSIQVQGDTKSSILTDQNLQVDLRVVESKSFGAALLYFTGSKNFNIKLRQIAIKRKMKINEYGVYQEGEKTAQPRCLAGKTEKQCFQVLELDDIPPELREDIGEARLFSGRKIPRLIELKDIQGDLHVHSTWSDGRHTIAQMVEAGRKRGYHYMAISDHSERLRVASGVSANDLKKKRKEIDQLNKKYNDFRILFGTEVEIDTDGNLDYNKKILSEFDIVIAAIHSGFEQSPEKLTRRLIKACQNPYVHIIAHPTGVHIGKRDPYHFDFLEVCKVTVDHGVAFEINAFPVRMDLNAVNTYFAKDQGARFSINTDSHHIDHLAHMPYGVKIARRGWLTKADVLNTYSLKNLEKILKK